MIEPRFKPGDLVYDTRASRWYQVEYIGFITLGGVYIDEPEGRYLPIIQRDCLTLSEALERGITPPQEARKVTATNIKEALEYFYNSVQGKSVVEHLKSLSVEALSAGAEYKSDWENKHTSPVSNTAHQHRWKSYTGLVETYDYCEVCNAKK